MSRVSFATGIAPTALPGLPWEYFCPRATRAFEEAGLARSPEAVTSEARCGSAALVVTRTACTTGATTPSELFARSTVFTWDLLEACD